MKLNIFSGLLFSIIIFSLIIISSLGFLIIKNQFELKKSNDIHFKSIMIAEELRKSSDDLTRYCRTYVSTKDTIWENKYWEVIDIRNGKKARADGKIISMRNIMKNLGFTKIEFDKLKEAEDNSNSLVQTERIAFNAMKGIFLDSLGKFTIYGKTDLEMARRIMFDKKYHYDKSKIMNPINNFIIILDKRTKKTYEKFNEKSFYLMFIAVTIIVITMFFSLFSFLAIKKRIEKQMENLDEKTKVQILLNDKLFAKNMKLEEDELKIKQQYEELQTSDEELKQSNEELETLNENIQKQSDTIKDKKKQLEILLDNLPSGIYFKNTKLEYIMVNKSYKELFFNEKLQKTTEQEISDGEFKKIYEDNDAEIIKTKKSKFNVIKKYKNIDNKTYYISSSKIIYINDKGNVKGIIGILQNVTERVLQYNQLKERKKIIEMAHKNIKESINYAKRIQESLITKKIVIDNYLKNYFIFFKAKEKVSGDFYYINKINKHIIIAIADCTGHGVAGGFLTVLGITYLHEIIRKKEKYEASKILEILREQFKSTFKEFGTNSTNGLDIALCKINTETNIMQYAGAYNPLIIIRDKKLIEYKGTRNPIGAYPKEKTFKNNKIKMQNNDYIYLYSDGFQDQAREKDNKKFMAKKFKEMLLDIHEIPMNLQKNKLNNVLKNWKGKNKQTDDILVFGMKFINKNQKNMISNH